MGKPVPVPVNGKDAIAMRSGQIGGKPALTPVELWTQVVQTIRGFESTPSGQADQYRQKPSTFPDVKVKDAKGDLRLPQAGDKGVNTGKGYETISAVQVVDANGKQVSVGSGHFVTGGLEDHAEARSIRALEKNGNVNAPGGRVVVVVDQDVCPSCEAKLRAFAQKTGAKEIEVHTPLRENMVKPGTMATPKTTAVTSFKNTGKVTSVKHVKTIPVAAAAGAVHAVPNIKTAVAGSIANLAAGIAVGILQDKMKDGMLKDLEAMPKPKPDERMNSVFFKDPGTKNAMRLIDLMGRNLKAFQKELDAHHTTLIASAKLEIGLLAVSNVPKTEQVEYIRGMEEQMNTYTAQLLIVESNMDAAHGIATKAIEAAESAEALVKISESRLVEEWLFKQGFTVEEMAKMFQNLKNFAQQTRATFKDVSDLRDRVKIIMNEANIMAHQVNKLSWSLSLEIIAAEMKRKGLLQ